jgi:hypothetical protein
VLSRCQVRETGFRWPNGRMMTNNLSFAKPFGRDWIYWCDSCKISGYTRAPSANSESLSHANLSDSYVSTSSVQANEFGMSRQTIPLTRSPVEVETQIRCVAQRPKVTESVSLSLLTELAICSVAASPPYYDVMLDCLASHFPPNLLPIVS